MFTSLCCLGASWSQGLAGPGKERQESGNVPIVIVVERVIQQDATGCGLACVAMVAGVTYSDVRCIAVEHLGFDPTGPFYTYLDDLRYMLDWFGYGLRRWTLFKTYGPISPLSVLEIERTGPHNHWVLLVKCALDMFVLDPSPGVKSTRRRDWYRLRPVSYANIIKY